MDPSCSNSAWKIEEIRRGQQLVIAAGAGDYIQVEKLLNSGVNVNAEEYKKSLFYASKNYMTPLQMACEKNNYDIVKFLIRNGADVDARDRFDVTAVHIAAEKGHELCLRELLDAGAECSVPTKHSKRGCYTAIPHPGATTPLHLAAANNHVSCVIELIQAGADYNAVDEKGRTSMYLAAQLGFEDCVLVHLKNAVGRDILSLPSLETGDTPLHFAISYGMLNCIRELLYLGSDPNHINHSGVSPIHFAVSTSPEVESCAEDILSLLILEGHGVDVNLEDGSGFTPLHYVCFNSGVTFVRRPRLAKILISYGANTNIKNQRGYSLLENEMNCKPKPTTLLRTIIQSMLHLPSLSSLRIKSMLRGTSPDHRGGFFEGFHHYRQLGLPRVFPEDTRYNANWLFDRMIEHESVRNRFGFPLPQKSNKEDSIHHWYTALSSQPRTLKHHCRYQIRSSLGSRKMRHIKDLPIPNRLQKYLLLDTDEL